MGGKYALIVRHHGPLCSLARVTAVALTVAVERLSDLTNRFQWHGRPFDPVRWSVGNRRQDFVHFGFHGVGNEFTRLIDKRVPKVTQRQMSLQPIDTGTAPSSGFMRLTLDQ